MTEGIVVLAATPLGNPADGSPRLRELIATADVIAAEDTRRFHRLASDLGIRPSGRVVSFYEGVEQARTPQLVAAARSGQTVLLVTDAGMPSVSDPGYRLVVACADAGVAVTVAPGPSAVITALAVSGLPSDRFCFEGFLPRKSGERTRRLLALVDEPRTMVFFESTHRLAASLSDMADAFGPTRDAVVCRELTKTYEEVRRAKLSELAEWALTKPRGEITVVVAGCPERPVDNDPVTLARAVANLIAGGTDKRDAIAEVAAKARLPKRTVYNAVLSAKPTP